MRPRNRPKFNTGSGLTPNGGGPAGDRPGSAPKGIETGPPRVSRRALRGFFAPGTVGRQTSGPARRRRGRGGRVDELAATLGRPGRAAAGVTVELAAAAPADVVETKASSRSGTAAAGPVEPAAQPARRGHMRVGRRVNVPGDVGRPNPPSPQSDGTAATWR